MNYASNYIVIGADFYNITPLEYTDDLIKLYFKNGHIRSLLKEIRSLSKIHKRIRIYINPKFQDMYLDPISSFLSIYGRTIERDEFYRNYFFITEEQ